MKRSRKEPRFIHRIVERLRREYHPTQVILFGSYAYGRPSNESDVDLLIVKETTKPFYQRMFEVRRALSPLLRRQPFDPIVMTPRELQQRLARGDQFFESIMTKGKTLYASG